MGIYRLREKLKIISLGKAANFNDKSGLTFRSKLEFFSREDLHKTVSLTDGKMIKINTGPALIRKELCVPSIKLNNFEKKSLLLYMNFKTQV